MATAEPDAALVAQLDTAIASLTAGTNLFTGRPRPPATGMPRVGVFVEVQGSPVNVPYMGAAKTYRIYDLQVTVRSEAGDYAGGLALARSCRDALHITTPTGYVSCRVQGEPYPVGQDEAGSDLFTLHVLLDRKI